MIEIILVAKMLYTRYMQIKSLEVLDQLAKLFSNIYNETNYRMRQHFLKAVLSLLILGFAMNSRSVLKNK